MSRHGHLGNDSHSSHVKSSRPLRSHLVGKFPNLTHEIWHEVSVAAKQNPVQKMCALCGRVPPLNTTRGIDPITGVCVVPRACAKRRRELDDETIEEFGLIPRKEVDSE